MQKKKKQTKRTIGTLQQDYTRMSYGGKGDGFPLTSKVCVEWLHQPQQLNQSSFRKKGKKINETEQRRITKKKGNKHIFTG